MLHHNDTGTVNKLDKITSIFLLAVLCTPSLPPSLPPPLPLPLSLPSLQGVFSVRSDGTLRTIAALDYESVTRYDLVVEVQDGGIPMLIDSTTVVVMVTDINDNAPIFIDLPSVVQISEVRAESLSIPLSESSLVWNPISLLLFLPFPSPPFFPPPTPSSPFSSPLPSPLLHSSPLYTQSTMNPQIATILIQDPDSGDSGLYNIDVVSANGGEPSPFFIIFALLRAEGRLDHEQQSQYIVSRTERSLYIPPMF